MTGMLENTQVNGLDTYRMAFPSYVEILDRLQRANKDTIEMLINEYEE
jgi:hypothetical protein